MRILITGLRAPVALEWARRFDQAEHEVIGADCLSLPIGRFSNAVGRYLRLPSPVATKSAFAIALEDLVREHKVDMIVPTCEEGFHIAMHLDDLPCMVYASEIDTLASLHNKWRFAKACLDAPHAPSPVTHRLLAADDVRRFIDDSSQWVFKPVYSRFASRTMIGASRWRLEQLKPTDLNPWIAQQRIYGREFSTFSLADHGAVFAHCAYEAPYRAGQGAGIYFQPIRHDQAQQAVEDIIATHRYTGQLGCDFMEDRDGKLWIIEANPRATSGLHLLPRDPQLVQRVLQTSNPVKAAEARWGADPDTRPMMVAGAMPFWGVVSALQEGRASYFRDFWAAKDVVGSLDDPLPWLAAPLAMLELLMQSLRTGKSPNQAATADIEWNG